jgi:hypothetical protein
VFQTEVPAPPASMVMPQVPQLVFTLIWGGITLGLAGYAGYEILRHRRPLLAVLLAGGALCYFAEPMVDVLGLLWHPTIGQWVAINTFRAAPLWGLFVYMICFGGLPYLMWLDFRRRVTRARAWSWVGAFWLVDVAVEIPILHFRLYDYYGAPPMEFAGLPLYWLFMNIVGPLATAVLLLRAVELFSGWWLLAVLLLPVSLDAAGSALVGWPIFSALNAGADPVTKYAAAILTVLIGVAVLESTIAYGVLVAVPYRPAGAEVRV